MRNPEAFCKLVKERVEELNMSAPDVRRAARNRVSTSTVWNIINGGVRNIDTETIEALAPAIKLPADLLFDTAYNLRRGELNAEELKLVIFYRNMPPDRQSDLIDIAGTMHRKHAVEPVEKIEKTLAKRKRAA